MACALGAILGMAVFLSVGLAVGLFVGHSLGRGSSTPECPTVTISPPPTPAKHSRQFNWGDWVNISDQGVSVFDWFDGVMMADNIKSNLQ